MPNPKPRIFISSVMEGFEAEREAARQGIIAADGEPILIDDSASQGASSRTACLDAVASCDALIVIVGARGGWITPSGKLVVEEEVDEARARNLPIRVFGQANVQRDEEGRALYVKLSDYISGYLRKEYQTCEELVGLVRDACADIQPLPTEIQKMTSKDSVRAITSKLVESDKQNQDASSVTLRVVIAPERGGRVIEPSKMEDRSFQHELISFALHPDTGLASYETGFAPSIQGDDLVLRGQAPEDYRHTRPTAVRITEGGVITVDFPLEIRQKEWTGHLSHDTSAAFAEEMLRKGIRSSLLLAHHLYKIVDPHFRYERLLVDVGIAGAAGKEMVETIAKLERPQRSGIMHMGYGFNQQQVNFILPRPEPTILSRAGLQDSDAFLADVVLYTKRRLAESREGRR